MAEPRWSGSTSRKIVERIIIEGDLILQTPAHFGNGDGDESVMPLLVSAHDGVSPLLTGTSVAGALRAYLRSRELGFRSAKGESPETVRLFGTSRREEGDQSRLIIDDALGQASGRELRDGVRIEPGSRTAADRALYSFQTWAAGTTFPLRFELLIYEGDPEDQLRCALATSLEGFNDSAFGITIGARKKRGYGRTSVPEWRVKRFDFRQGIAVYLDWLRLGADRLPQSACVTNLLQFLSPRMVFPDERRMLQIDARFTLGGSLLIRSDSTLADMGHLTSRQADGVYRPVLSGTSLTGAIRARATKIASTVYPGDAEALITGIFGSYPEETREARVSPLIGSRLTVEEHPIEGGSMNWVQNRVSIDRFTGGALDTALFNQQPVFASEPSGIQIRLALQNPNNAEVGLLLLVLKDLWLEDLPLGGESSVGRGRLHGEWAQLSFEGGSLVVQRQGQNGLSLVGLGELQPYIDELVGAS